MTKNHADACYASLHGSIKQFQLVLRQKHFLRHLVFVGGDETRYILLNQLDGSRFSGFAIIAQRTVLSSRQLEGDRVIVVIATLPFLILSHNTLI